MLALEERAAAFLGQEEAVYLPTATMANQIALAILGARGTELVVEETAHIMIAELGGAAAALGPADARASGISRAADGRPDPGGGPPRGSLPHTARIDRRAREHAQQRRRHRLAARRARGGRRGVARARARGASGRRPDRERVGRPRRSGGADRRSVRHGDAVPLEGARLPARRRDRRIARSDGAGQGREAPLRRGDAAGRASSQRRGSTRSSTTSTGSRTTTPAHDASPRDGPHAESRSISKRSRRTSSRSTSARSGSPHRRRIERLAAAGVGLSSTIRPGILRAVTHLDIDDAGIDEAIEVVPQALELLARA